MTLREYMKAQGLTAEDLAKEITKLQEETKEQEKKQLAENHEHAIQEAKEVLARYIGITAKYYDRQLSAADAKKSAELTIDSYEKYLGKNRLTKYYSIDEFMRDMGW
jgi:hypothetical protein